MLEFIEVSLADTHRLFYYRQTCPLEIGLGVKGFDYAWLVECRDWKAEEKILDVGGAYSCLPLYIQQTHGCEVWVADDFAAGSGDTFWQRHRSPQEYISSHPEIHFVMEYVGDEKKSSLPLNAFDVVYSISVMEHVPPAMTAEVWQHMVRLLKPGGELIQAIDIPFPSNDGMKKFLAKCLFDLLNPLIPYPQRLKHYLSTPVNYIGLVCQIFSLPRPKLHGLNVWRMCLDPEIVTESYEFGYNRITKDKVKNYRYRRTGSLLLRMKKAEAG